MSSLARLLTILALLSVLSCTSAPPPTAPVPTATASVPTLGPLPLNAPAGTVLELPSMTSARAAHTATLLRSGKVLLVGGFAANENALSSTELFDPATRSFSPTGALSVARQSHTATLLPNGKVLIAGGYNGDYLASAELYDPTTGTFTPTGAMTMARHDHVAMLLDDGKVLLAGGVGTGWTFLESAELYDPVTGTFSATGAMSAPRESHTLTLLADGKGLITGGHQGRHSAITIYASAELYDPIAGRFTPTGDMRIKRHKHDATRLNDGRVLITGGADERDERGTYRSAELYDPQTGAFSIAGNMNAARYKHKDTAVVLQNGKVLLLGGASVTEIYDPTTSVFSALAHGVDSTRLFATATRLVSGEVLFAGGYGTNVAASAKAWLFVP